jgi:hypothetical protein
MDNGDNPNPEVKQNIEQQAQVPKPSPKCPHCGKGPAMIDSGPLVMGNLNCIFFCCAYDDCRKIINIQVMGVAQTQAPLVQPASGFPTKLKM